MDSRLAADIGARLESAVVRSRSVTGGDINESCVLSLADGRQVFVKTNRRAPDNLFATEAKGLAWLSEANAIRIPATIAVTDRFLVLEWVSPGTPAPDFDERLGRQLADLHRASPSTFGLGYQNFIGPLPQSNTSCDVWSDFYRTQRLEPQIRRATDQGFLSPKLRRSLTRVLSDLDRLVGPAESPARLHGDLWNGNVICDENGQPCLVDPSVYGGHREMDLAMMRLFGGFSDRVFAAYDEAFPLAAESRSRIPLYQLYPLLVHLNLFGGAYLSNLESTLGALDTPPDAGS